MTATPPITGYRKLSDGEIALMNEGKALAETVGAFVAKLRAMPPAGHGMEMQSDLIDGRWLSVGATDLQKGFMSVLRSIARPLTF